RPARHRLRAAGPRDISVADGGRKPEDRLRPPEARPAQHSRRRVLAVSRAGDHARSQGRRSLRRPAAAARHRPGAGDAAETPAARRADRRHPALDHQGHRPRDFLPAQPRQHRHRAGRTISRLCLRARRQFRRHGSRRGEIYLPASKSRSGRDQPPDGP
ncbi:hypothetical protein KXV77_000837, partial [Aspergillus fumigatus]